MTPSDLVEMLGDSNPKEGVKKLPQATAKGLA